MENNSSIFKPVVDSVFGFGSQLVKLIKNDNSFDFSNYFEQVKLYTQTEKGKKIKPELQSKKVNEHGIEYIFSIPAGADEYETMPGEYNDFFDSIDGEISDKLPSGLHSGEKVTNKSH